MKFCSRCGVSLCGLAEWLASGAPLPTQPILQAQPQTTGMSPRRKGIRRGGKVMFFSGVLFVICMGFSLAIEEPGPLILPFAVFLVGLAMMLYARLFSEDTPSVPALDIHQPAMFTAAHMRSALPSATNVNIPPLDRPLERPRVRTNELAQPPSVTENTTRLLDDE